MSRMNREGLKDVKDLILSYVPEFRDRMLLSPEEAGSPEALQRAVSGLEGAARDLAEALIIGVGGGQPLPDRFHSRVDEAGEGLWLSAVLLPKIRPSKGSTIDPRYYTASSWVNPALSRVRPLSEVHGTAEGEASPPPSSTEWDARVLAVGLEAEPMRVTQSGDLRKDDVERMVLRLGGDVNRWKLAMAMARETGLARLVGNRLHGFPCTRPRMMRDPIELLEGREALAAEALMRIIGKRWVSLELLSQVLTRRCPEVLDGVTEGPATVCLRAAASAMQRFGQLDAICDTEGVKAVRKTRGALDVPRGIIVTSDGEILVVPGALTSQDFGRLCRMAPYQGGDVIYRHRLCREGVAADLAAGYTEADTWLESLAPAGLSANVVELIRGWTRSIQRVTLWTGVTILEEDGVLTRVTQASEGLPAFDYSEPCLGDIELTDYRVEVPKEACPLGLKAALDRVLPRDSEASEGTWCWSLSPVPLDDSDARIAEIRSRTRSELPGSLEAALHVAGGRRSLQQETAIVLHMDSVVLNTLRRDSALGPLLERVVQPGQVLVAQDDLPSVREGLLQLGLVEG